MNRLFKLRCCITALFFTFGLTSVYAQAFVSMFSSTVVPVPINGAIYTHTTVPVVVNVHLTVTSIKVRLNITCPYNDNNLRLTFFDPTPTGTILMTEGAPNGNGSNFTNTVFWNGATTTIYNGFPPYNGFYLPGTTLAAHHGIDAFGTWYVDIYNTGGVGGGVVTGLELEFNDGVLPPQNWGNPQIVNGPGGLQAWIPFFAPDLNTAGGLTTALEVEFQPLVVGANPVAINVKRDNRTNVTTLWGMSALEQTDLNAALPAATSIDRFWNVSVTGGTGYSATLHLKFNSTDRPPSITDPVNQIHTAAVKHGTNAWSSVPCTVTGPDGNGVYTATINNVTAFSQWALGNGGILPVELTSFTAVGGDNRVTLKWRTESEFNNAHFNLYRSTVISEQGIQVTQVDGHGTTSLTHDYSFNDNRVQNGITYFYRLSDVDADGVERVHPMVVQAMPSAQALGVLPEKYALSQNYPNPFNPSTEFTYSLPEAERVRLVVCDVTGRTVTTLVNEIQQPNVYRVKFDASRLPSGIYFYTLSTGNYSSTKRMVLMK